METPEYVVLPKAKIVELYEFLKAELERDDLDQMEPVELNMEPWSLTRMNPLETSEEERTGTSLIPEGLFFRCINYLVLVLELALEELVQFNDLFLG
ncbi:hypothetical protein TCAL_16711 [Tigriopus californicus]|uniref:Uncharacterized protein n=1 Tax=Tigriopus californicus TaxID=6832 RepID=A0A553PM84_TIGCA|nr:hypothetical protein TCAL_16711 [Tigriopus californicus]